MTTHNTRKMLGNITQKEFADRFHIPVATVKNWDARNCMPDYIFFMCNEIYLAKQDYNRLWDNIINDNKTDHPKRRVLSLSERLNGKNQLDNN